MGEGLSDEQLVGLWQAARGSPGANVYLDELFRRHRRRLALWCLRFAGDRETAADWGQEICVAVCRNLDSFRGDSKFSTWLYTVARNYCLNAVRTRAARPAEDPGCELDVLADTGGLSPYARLEAKESASLLRQFMHQALTETEFRVMMLHYAEEVPLDAVTRLLGLENASGAKAYVVSGRRKLKEAVERFQDRFLRTRGTGYANGA